MGRLASLKQLTLRVPNETEIPEEIGNLTNLVSFDLPYALRTECNKKIIKLLEMIKEKEKILGSKNHCFLTREKSYLGLSVKNIYTPKGTFPFTGNELELKIVSQNFQKEIENIEKKLAVENAQVDTFKGFKIRVAVDDNTMITVTVEADGWGGFINSAYREYRQERPPTVYKYIHEVPYFDDLLNSNEPFWNDLTFAEVVLLHFKKIMKELTKDAYLNVYSESKMGSWDITDFEDFQKNPHVTKLEKIVPVKSRKVEKSSEDLRKNEDVPHKQKVYLEVRLTPDIYLDESGLAARRRLFTSQSAQPLTIHHDSGNRYDSKAIKVFYDHTDIGFIMKKGSNGKVDDFCFEGNSFLEDVELIWENEKLVLTKNEEG